MRIGSPIKCDLLALVLVLGAATVASGAGARITVPLDGTWQIEDSVQANEPTVLDDDAGRELRRETARFSMEALGRETLALAIALPAASGRHWLNAVASANPALPQGDTISRRKFELVPVRRRARDPVGRRGEAVIQCVS